MIKSDLKTNNIKKKIYEKLDINYKKLSSSRK